MLTVHHLGISQSDRIVWLCEELAIHYKLIRYTRDPETNFAPKEYKALHPFGTAPVITDGDVVLGESGAIIEYIIGKYGNGRLSVSADKPNFADYLYWFHFANGSLMASSMVDMAVNGLGGAGDNQHIRRLCARSDLAFDMIDKRLSTAKYFAGEEFTAADIIMLFPLTTMRVFLKRDISGYPHLVAYLQRISKRAAYRHAMELADPDLDLTPLLN